MATERSGSKTAAKVIVFADNDVLLLEAIGEILRNKDYEVHPARDGLEALQAIRTLKPNSVIMDIVMPKIDGSRVCWLIRQDRHLRHTPIIAFSGLGPQDIRRFPELSADAYVAKGPLAVVSNNLLLALRYVEEKGRGDFEGGIFGFEGFRPRKLISEMLHLKRHWETMIRTVRYGVLELDPDGRILMANPEASRILRRKEIHLIGETLPSLFPLPEQMAIQQILDQLKKAHSHEEFRVVLPLSGQEISVQLASTIEEGECTSILVMIEPGASGADPRG